MTEFSLPPHTDKLRHGRARRLQAELDALFSTPRLTLEDLQRFHERLDAMTEVRAKYITPVMLARGFFR
jgi:hypothetical protein